MTLAEKQQDFARKIAELILWANGQGYRFTFGDAYRDPRLHGAVGVKVGYGAASSCHKLRLAVDLNLFVDGKYQETTEAHRPIGEKWESMGGSWGGRFNDANHYSFEHEGKR